MVREAMEERNDALEIDLQKLLLAYLQKWWLIVLCGVIVATCALVYTMGFVTPMYRASVTVYVNNIRSNQQIDYLSESNLMASQRLVNTYINIAESDRVLEQVAAKLNLEGTEYTVKDLRKMLSAAQVDETEIFQLYITHPDPEEAARIANVMAEVAPDDISDLIEGSSARIIDYAKVPEARFSPSYKKNLLLGGMVGCFLAVAYLTLMFLLDVRVKDEEDLMAISDYPILGRIPEITPGGVVTTRKKYTYETAAPTGGKGGGKR